MFRDGKCRLYILKGVETVGLSERVPVGRLVTRSQKSVQKSRVRTDLIIMILVGAMIIDFGYRQEITVGI